MKVKQKVVLVTNQERFKEFFSKKYFKIFLYDNFLIHICTLQFIRTHFIFNLDLFKTQLL